MTESGKPLSIKAQKLARLLETNSTLNADERLWLQAHGGVEGLDGVMVRTENGKSFPILRSTWRVTAQVIKAVMSGKAQIL